MTTNFSKILLVSLCWLFIFSALIRAQESQEKMRLHNADSMSGMNINGQSVIRLVGNVEFRQGDAVVLCNEAHQYQDEEKTVFVGDVSFTDKNKAIYGDIVTYYEPLKMFLAVSNVKLVDSTKTLLADTLEYYEDEEKAIAKSNVHMLDDAERVELTGKYTEYLRETGYAKVLGNPVFSKMDSTDEIELTIKGELIESFDDGDSVKVVNNVEIIRGEINAQCGKLTYFKTEDKISLQLSPSAIRVNDKLTGNVIDLLLLNNKVTDINVFGRAVVTTKVDSAIETSIPYDILTGEKVLVSVFEEKIDTVIILGRATSYYHVIDDSVEQGINKVLGDEILMVFEESAIKQVYVKSSPSVSVGSVFPPNAYNRIENELVALLTKNDILVNKQSDTVTVSP